MKAYVINLKKRPDRLERFMSNIGNFVPSLSLDVIEGVDGHEIDPYDAFHKKNVNPWNYKHLSDRALRGVIGCCRSHMKAYKNIIEQDIPNALIFEDDAHPSVDKLELDSHLYNIVLPEKFSVIYLSKYRKSAVNNKDFSLEERNNARETTEAYIISNEFSQLIYNYCKTNIGAIDAHLDQCYQMNKDYKSYSLKSELFHQFNRQDSDIR